MDASEIEDSDNGISEYICCCFMSTAEFDLEAPQIGVTVDADAYLQGLSGRDLAECPLALLLLLLILVLLPRLLKKRENGKLDCFGALEPAPPLDDVVVDRASWDALIPCAYGKFNKLLLLFLLGIIIATDAAAAAELSLSLSGTSKAVLFGGGFMYVLVSSACKTNGRAD